MPLIVGTAEKPCLLKLWRVSSLPPTMKGFFPRWWTKPKYKFPLGFFFLHSRCLHVMCVHCLWAALSSPLARERFQKPGNTRKRPVAINAISNETGIGARARCGRNYGTFPMGVRRVAMLGMGAKFVFHSPHRNGVLCLPSNLHRALRADIIIPLNIPARNTDSIQ